jgi:hypothetical protein
MRKVDIAHSGQTVSEALEQLVAAIKQAQRTGDDALLVVHGFGASGVGGAIKDAVVAELPRLERAYGFKSYSAEPGSARIPRELNFDPRRLSRGSSLLVFRKQRVDKDSDREFRPNYRNLRRVKFRRSTT